MLGISAADAGELTAIEANHIINAALPWRPDILRLLHATMDPDERPLEADMTMGSFRENLARGDYGNPRET